ncbi:O-antigen ligase [Alloacidobacterium sp.]|uniref:O-antigen ligase family protein n=1 Tax=Alloacidobacterium sp. TaxID=2951999 RepID=UPI002D560369|nr:O-antigen ligase [Alloacidobacterium sp.]HYK36745.1 O-antigen ligase [Alloacidobacterium sp.]
MWKRLEMIFAVCALLFCAGAFVPLLNQNQQVSDVPPQNKVTAAVQKQARNESSDPTNANPAILAGQIIVYAVVAVLLLFHRREAIRQLRDTKLIWAVVAMAFVSVLWSQVPGFALRRCLNMAATSGFGLYLAFRYSPRQLLRLLGWAFLVAIVCSIVVVLIRPDLGVDSAFTNFGWKGIFVQKNTFGRFMALGVLVFWFLAFESRTHRFAYGAASVLCACMIFATRSATSALSVPILLGLIWLFALARRRSLRLVLTSTIISMIGISCCLMLFVDPSNIFSLVGRDSTMSGRLEIWNAVIPKIMAHPWLGYGYSSFWLGMEGQSSADIWSILRWPVPHSHNGFLDLLEELGVVGLGLFLAGFIMSLRHGLQWARNQRTAIGLWPLAYLSFMFLFNLSEGSILRQDNLFWALYIATSVFVVVKTKELSPELLQDSLTQIGTPMPPQYAPLGRASENAMM